MVPRQADDAAHNGMERRPSPSVAEHAQLARERARLAMERASDAEWRARDRLERAGERSAIMRQLAGALLAATTAPALVDHVVDHGFDPMLATAELADIDTENGTVRVVMRFRAPGAPEHAVSSRESAVAQATLRAAERARLYDTERRLRATLEAVVQQMPVGVVVADAPSGAITLANQHAGEMLGEPMRPWTTAEDYGEVHLLTMSGRRLRADEWPLARAVREGVPIGGQQIRVRAADGSERTLLMSAVPVLAPDGTVTAAVQVMFDVTVREEATLAREAILGVLSHELRTPVTTLLGGSELLHDHWSSLGEAEREELMAANVAEAERLNGLIDNMLVLARIDAGVSAVERHPILLQHAVERVMARERRRFPETRFELDPDSPRGMPAVLGDDGAVDQVLSNLFSNAAKYGRPGGAVLVSMDEREDEVEVRVLDDGPGLRPEESAGLFRLFVRGVDAPRRASGAGIGLYVTSRLVDSMGGRVWATNREGGGAEFGFALTVSPSTG